MLDGDGKTSVDTKRSVQELSSNLLNRSDSARFWREVKRAKESGVHLVILVKTNRYKSIPDLVSWRSKYSGVNGRSLVDAIYRCHISYGVEFLFAPKISTARKIVEILTCNSTQNSI